MRIEVKSKDYPYEEMTQLLHICYKEHLDAGRRYLASVQTVEQTKERVDGSYCALAYDGNTLVGMACSRIKKLEDSSHRKWYEDDLYLHVDQLAVLPAYRNTMIIAMMALKLFKQKEIKECKSLIGDTSCEAHELVQSYVKIGAKIVDLVSWPTTNYYSYVFRKNLNGKEYSEAYCRFRFVISKMLCMLQYTKEGMLRFKL